MCQVSCFIHSVTIISVRDWTIYSKIPVEKPVVLNKQVFVNCGVVSESSDNYSVMDGQSEYSVSVMDRIVLVNDFILNPLGVKLIVVVVGTMVMCLMR